MLFKHYGVEVTEEELAIACKTDSFGTTASDAVAAAHQYGFNGSGTDRLDFDTLRERVEENLLPIVFVDLLPRIPPQPHALIVFDITGDEPDGFVHILDPDPVDGGEESLPVGEFKRRWKNGRFRTVIVKPA
jgi:ABC-type bacteriocin/lantibiotic exporter with double-glycine peptidase domain